MTVLRIRWAGLAGMMFLLTLPPAFGQAVPPTQEPWPWTEEIIWDCIFAQLDETTPWEGVWYGQDGLQIIDASMQILTPPSDFLSSSFYRRYTITGDLDGDGNAEIVVPSGGKKLYAFHNDGTAVDGWPITVGQELVGVDKPLIALADFDGDGDMEVVASAQQELFNPVYEVFVYQHDGSVLPGWPAETTQPASGLAVGDLEFDGELEVVVTTFPEGAESDPSPVFVFNQDGSLRWSRTPGLGAYAHTGLPCIADLDGDGFCEIFGTSGNHAVVLDRFGNKIRAYYPADGFGAGHSIGNQPPAIGDVDGDGDLDIVTSGNGSLYVLDLKDGMLANRDPDDPKSYTGVSIADVDGDGDAEIGCWQTAGIQSIQVMDYHLQDLPGWPISFERDYHLGYGVGWDFGHTQFFDMDGDGDLEFGYSRGTITSVFDYPATVGTPHVYWSGARGKPSGSAFYHEGEVIHRYMRGDANQDGVYGIADAVTTLGYLFLDTEVPCVVALDVDGNDVLGLSDVIFTLNAMFLGGAVPGLPYPGCGRIPRASTLGCDTPFEDCP